MREAVGVHVRIGDRERVGARVGEEVGRLGEERRGGDDVGELRGELAEAQVLAALVDEPEGGGVPERRGATVAEQHLVAVRQGEQLGQPVPQRPHLELDAGLAVRGAEVLAAGARQRLHRLRAHLRGSAAEAAVERQEVGWDLDLRDGVGGHRAMIADESSKERDRWPPPVRMPACRGGSRPSPSPPPSRSTPRRRRSRRPASPSSASGRASPTSRRRPTSWRRPSTPAATRGTTSTRPPAGSRSSRRPSPPRPLATPASTSPPAR